MDTTIDPTDAFYKLGFGAALAVAYLLVGISTATYPITGAGIGIALITLLAVIEAILNRNTDNASRPIAAYLPYMLLGASAVAVAVAAAPFIVATAA